MSAKNTPCRHGCDLRAPRRNSYFFGKLLDQYHFELETNYFIHMRRLLNRLVTGYGVVCGLDVKPCGDDAVIVTPGLAIDRHGNEIIVDQPTRPICIPSDDRDPSSNPSQDPCDDEKYVHILICYHECFDEPTPVMAGDCCEAEPCQPGVIRERYKVLVRPGAAPASTAELHIPDVISGCDLDYRTLVRVVTNECPPCAEEPCIPLANVRLRPESERPRCRSEDIDIAVRPIVFNNDLLFQLLVSKIKESSYRNQK